LFKWLEKENPDFICLQEVRAQIEDMKLDDFWPDDYHCYHHVAQKKGYSGVALFSKRKPSKITQGLGSAEFDAEGRYIECDFKDFVLASVYFPSGSSGDPRQKVKYRFLDIFKTKIDAMKKKKTGYLFCGDINIVHKERDITNWKANQKNSGCLPEERAWLDLIFDELNCTDSFREINSNAEQYTWWSNRGNAWANNVGWRIDYQIYNDYFQYKVRSASIYKEERFSDHAPLIIEYEQNK